MKMCNLYHLFQQINLDFHQCLARNLYSGDLANARLSYHILRDYLLPDDYLLGD